MDREQLARVLAVWGFAGAFCGEAWGMVRLLFRKWGRMPRRWVGRVALGTGLLAVGLLGLGWAAWSWRVALLNGRLEGGGWRARLEQLDWEGGRWVLRGLRVSQVDQVEPVLVVDRLEVGGAWREVRRGRLGALRAVGLAVHWRSGRGAAASGGGRGGVGGDFGVEWDSLQVVGGTVDVAEAGSYAFKGRVDWQGGPGSWSGVGVLVLSPQQVAVGEALYRQEWAEGVLEVAARRVEVEGRAEGGRLGLRGAVLEGARLQWGPPTPGAAVRGEPADGGEPGPIREVALEGLRAPGLEMASLGPRALKVVADLSLAGMAAGAGRSLEVMGLRMDRASAELPGGGRVAQLALEGGMEEGRGRLGFLQFEGAEVPDAAALLRGLGLELGAGWTGSGKAEGRLEGLEFEGAGVRSAAVQRVTLREVKLGLGERGEVAVARVALEGVPDEMAGERRLRRLEVEAPVAEWTWLQAGGEAPWRRAAPSVGRPAWEGWTADRLTVTGGQLGASWPEAGGARAAAGWALRTVSGEGEAPRYALELNEPQLGSAAFPDQPIARAQAVEVRASAAGLWQRRQIESVSIRGARLQVGEGLFRLAQEWPQAAPVGEEAGPPRQAVPPWLLGRVAVEDALVELDHLGDGRRLEIPINFQEFRDLPLDAAALAGVERVYQVEVPNVTLRSPFGAGEKAVVLDTNYIKFTPSGLLERRLERVDLMLPTIYAGQPLFDFVDAARKRLGALAGVGRSGSGGSPLLVDRRADSAVVRSALAQVSRAEAGAGGAWHIPFYTESGQVLVAPKGHPWPHLPAIPFRNARDAAGKPVPFLLQGETFHGELAIEPGWYEFPEYKFRLRLSDRGRIVFNTPQQDHDNNLTEVFENNTLIFRQLRVDDAWLSVTYDARGIYARFGGRSCGGSLSGGCNLYLDELYTWDAWVSLTGIAMEQLTDKLSPDTFRMSGPVEEITAKAYGDSASLYQAALDLKVTQPGTLQLLALDALREKLKALGGLRADLGKISLESLRDFAYTDCQGSWKLFGSEGGGQLVMRGPTGSRTFQVKLHDYRARPVRTAAPF